MAQLELRAVVPVRMTAAHTSFLPVQVTLNDLDDVRFTRPSDADHDLLCRLA